MSEQTGRIRVIHLSATPYYQESPQWYEQWPVVIGALGLIGCLLSGIGLQNPAGPGVWIYLLLLSVDVVIGSVIGAVWQSRDAEIWRRIPFLPDETDWLCCAVCGFLLVPMAMSFSFMGFIYLAVV